MSSDIKAPVGSSRAANKAAFTDDEIKRTIAACGKVKVEWKNETGTGEWTGEDLKDLIWLMLYTGHRIPDATLFSFCIDNYKNHLTAASRRRTVI